MTKFCCDVFPMMAHHFGWFSPEGEGSTLLMPYLQGVQGNKWRINHCPSCGKPVRDIEVKVEDAFWLEALD